MRREDIIKRIRQLESFENPIYFQRQINKLMEKINGQIPSQEIDNTEEEEQQESSSPQGVPFVRRKPPTSEKGLF